MPRLAPDQTFDTRRLREIKMRSLRLMQARLMMHATAPSRDLYDRARSLARTGEYGCWPSVRTRLIQLGFAEIVVMASNELAAEINALCALYYRPSGDSD
jgi:hypothetical protein